MRKITYLIAMLSFVISSCTNEQEEVYVSKTNEPEFYINTGKNVEKLSTQELFPWLTSVEKKKVINQIQEVFSSRNTRSSSGNGRRVVAYGYQTIVSGKTQKMMFTDSLVKQIGVPPNIYIISKHAVTQSFACPLNKEITPFPLYSSPSYQSQMGLESNSLSPIKRGFKTNLSSNVTKSDKFEGTTYLIRIHSDIQGRTGYKEWWPCSPEELVWIYWERENTLDWGI